MDKETILAIVQEMHSKNNVVEFNKIPEIDLYMDQLTTFIEEKLKGYKRLENDKILTKTMINNYTKDKILPAPVNKKYSSSHIALLVLIFHLKNGLSMTDIKSVIDSIEESSVNLEDFYNSFTKLQISENESFLSEVGSKFSFISEIFDDMNIDDAEVERDKTLVLLTVIDLIVQAGARKQLAEKLIDEFLSERKPQKK